MTDFRNASHPLSSGDALFLYLERRGVPINVAAMCTFEGVIPLELCTDFIESKLPLIPRYLQRVVAPPFDLGLPTWEFDPNFDIRNHVREVTLKHGTETEFKAVAGKVMSSNLRRDRPLWDFTLVHGLKGNRTGLIIRIHHCLADGISGVGVMNTILDPSSVPPTLPKKKERVQAPPLPSPSLIESLIKSYFTVVERALNVESQLLEMAHYAIAGAPSTETHDSLNGNSAEISPANDLTQLIPAFGSPTYRLPFNVVCQGPQNFNWAEISLEEMKAVKDICGATINDVVLTVVTSAIRRHAELHGAELAGKSVRIIVPVNLRSEGELDLGNRITFLPVNIPLDIPNPRELLQAVRQAVACSRKAHMAELVGLVGTIVETVPTPFQSMLLPIISELPLSVCNTIVTNVPGPTIPLYLLGHKMLSCYPYVPIGGEMGMNCAVLSYNGTVYFGFAGDTHAIPDLVRLEKFLTTSFAELKRAAGIRSPRRRRARPTPESKAVSHPRRKSRRAQDSGPATVAPEPELNRASKAEQRKGASSPAEIPAA